MSGAKRPISLDKVTAQQRQVYELFANAFIVPMEKKVRNPLSSLGSEQRLLMANFLVRPPARRPARPRSSLHIAPCPATGATTSLHRHTDRCLCTRRISICRRDSRRPLRTVQKAKKLTVEERAFELRKAEAEELTLRQEQVTLPLPNPSTPVY